MSGMAGNMGRGGGMPGGTGRGASSALGGIASRGVGGERCGSGLDHGDLIFDPPASGLDRQPRPIVVGLRAVKEREDVLGALRGPECKQVMIGGVGLHSQFGH